MITATATTATTATWTEYATLLGCKNLRDERDAMGRTHRCLAALGYVKTCGRCGGSGHFSRNAYGDTRCYDCTGRGTVLRNVTRKLVTEAAERVARGELDAWREENRKRAEAKRALAPLHKEFDAISKGGIAQEYEDAYQAKRRVGSFVWDDALHRAQEMRNSIWESVYETRHTDTYHLTPEQCVARVAWSIAALNELTAAWTEYKLDRAAEDAARETAATITEW